MINIRPHSISFKENVTPQFDENGDPVASKGCWSIPMECRYELGGRTNIQRLKDGMIKEYDYVVYMDYTGKSFDGRTARLYNEHGCMVCEGIVHHTTPSQLSTVIYIQDANKER